MKRVLGILMVLMGCTILTTGAVADDVDDVKAAVLAMDAALRAGDADAFGQYMHPEQTAFVPGEPLIEGLSKDPPYSFKFLFFEETKVDVETRHLSVKIYGNTAVVTGYKVGMVASFAGITQVNNQFTEVWIKQEGKWKRVHSHESPLTPQRQ